jgi:hypothetical protein
MMDREGLATLHVVEQQEVIINIERGESKIRNDTIFIRWNGWS